MMSSSRKSSTFALSVDHLSKRFGDRITFDNVSSAVGHGEVFGFLGPNGAGKTATVRTLGTVIAPTSGSATVAGISLTPENGEQIRQRISIMPESPSRYLRLPVRENLECFAGVLKNALDWASRLPRQRALMGKSAALMGASPGPSGTAGSQADLRRVLARTPSRVLAEPQVLFANANPLFDDPANLIDDAAR
jgi:ABC-2 type transport system ATP-binding protein